MTILEDDQTLAAGVLCLVLVALSFLFPEYIGFAILGGVVFLWLIVRLYRKTPEKA